MRAQKAEIDNVQLQLAQSAQKIRSSVERELRETFQTVKDERDRLRDLVKNLECSAKDSSQKLSVMSEELTQGREELRLAYANTEELKLELNKKNMLVTQETDKVMVLERQLEIKSHHCNDLERERNHMRRKLEEQSRPKKVTATQTLPDFDIAEQDNRIACLEDKLAVTERRIKDALDHLTRTAKERDALRGQLNDAVENSSAIQLKLDNHLSTLSNLESDLQQSADEIYRLERIISEREKRIQELEHAADEMNSSISSLTAENEVLKQHKQSDDEKLNSLVSSLEQKNSELTAQVCRLTEELQAKLGNDREILLQKDEVIAQLQLELDTERQVNRQRHGAEAEPAHVEGGICTHDSSVSDAAKRSVSLDRLKKQHEMELRDAEVRRSELASQVDSLKHELRSLEISHQQKVSEVEEKVADLTSKLSSAERRTCRVEQKRISSSSQTTDHEAQTSGDRLDRPSNILSLMQTPIGNDETRGAASVPKTLPCSDTAGGVPEPHQRTGSKKQRLITTLQSRVCELEHELEKSKTGKRMDEHGREVVSIFVVFVFSAPSLLLVALNPCGIMLSSTFLGFKSLNLGNDQPFLNATLHATIFI